MANSNFTPPVNRANRLKLYPIVFLLGLSFNLQSQGITIIHKGLETLQGQGCALFGPLMVSSVLKEQKQAQVVATLTQNGVGVIQRSQGTMTLEPGMNDCRKVNGITTESMGGVNSQLLKESGWLIPGEYHLCYEVILNGVPSKECATSIVSNQQVLDLVYPYNEDEVQQIRPPLNWLFLKPLTGVEYDITLKEKQADQSNRAALELNPPIVQVQGHKTTTLVYPGGAPALEKNKTYVWQVAVRKGNTVIAQSEIWSFYLTDPEKVDPIHISDDYIDLGQVEGAKRFYALGMLRMKWQEDYKSRTATIEIRNKKGKKLKLGDLSALELKLGENYFDLDLSEVGGLRHMQPYTITLSSKSFKGGSISLTMTYLNPELYKAK